MDSKYTLELPIAIGETIYEVVRCHCYASYAQQCQSKERNRTTARKTAIYIKPLDGKRSNTFSCIKIYARPFDPFKHLHKIGKTVFTTPEDAMAYEARRGI